MLELALIHTVDEFDDALHEDFLVVPHGQVATVGAVEITSFLHGRADALHFFGAHRVVFCADGQCGDGDGWELIPYAPAFQSAAGDEFAVCENCRRGKVIKSMQTINFRQWSDRGYIRCSAMIMVGVCDHCDARSLEEGVDKILDEAFQREYDKLR